MFVRGNLSIALPPPVRGSVNVGRAILLGMAIVSLVPSSTLALDRQNGQDSDAELPYVPSQLLIKFKPEAARALHEQSGQVAGETSLKLSDSLNRLFEAHRVRTATPVFRDFAAVRERLERLQLRAPAGLSASEQHLLARRRRAPADAPIPALDRIYRLELDPGVSVQAAVDDFSEDPSVEFAEPNYIVRLDLTPDDPYFGVQWALHNTGQTYPVSRQVSDAGTPDSDVDAPEAWDVLAPSGESVIVAVVDSGVDYNHRDLAESMWTDEGGRYGYDFVDDDDDPMDGLGHGTHIAGIIAAGFNNGIGISGLCPNARIMAVKFADATSGLIDLAAQGIYYATNHGADIISNSYGGFTSSETEKAAIEFAHSQGAILVASAGNMNTSIRRYPASYDQVIAVASTDSDDIKAGSSSYGNWIDLAAPGVDILSLRAAGTDMYGGGFRIIDTYYYVGFGTSMACPHVAAVAGLILAKYPDLNSEQVVARLLGTTDEIVAANPTQAHLLGTGRVNAHNALADPEHPAIAFADLDILDDVGGNGNGVLEPGETASLLVFLENLWADATDVHATLGAVSPEVTILDAVSSYGALASGQKLGNVDDPLEIRLSDSAPSGTEVELTLAVTASGGYNRVLGFTTMRKPRLQEGVWPRWGFFHSEPIPYDLDGDGQVELILRIGNVAKIVEPDGSITAVFSNPLDWTFSLAVGDIQRDGHVEIVLSSMHEDTHEAYLTIWDNRGRQVCPLEDLLPPQVPATVVLYDLDGDDDLEIVTQGLVRGRSELAVSSFDLLEGGLELQWQTLLELDDGFEMATRLSVGDIDAGNASGDGGPELVFGAGAPTLSRGGELYALRSNGQIVDGWPVVLAYATERAPALADLTGDGNLEIIINTYNNEDADGLRVWNHAGRLLWTASGRGRAPVVADLDGDGDLEVVTQTAAYHHDGSYTGWRYYVINPGGASVGDIDGDGDMEVLIGGAGRDGLRAYHHNGSPVEGFPVFVDALYKSTSMTPILDDLDGDGDVEIVASGEYLAAWDVYGKHDAHTVEWGMFRHDPYRTGNYNANINLPPVWHSAPEDQVFVRRMDNEIYVQAGDPERQAVSYEVLGIPEGAKYHSEGPGIRFYWHPQRYDLDQEVTFCATDAGGERVEKAIHISLVDTPIDLDGDGDSDWDDYRIFRGCYAGPGQEPARPDCDAADTDDDGDVDLDDYAALQVAFGDVR